MAKKKPAKRSAKKKPTKPAAKPKPAKRAAKKKPAKTKPVKRAAKKRQPAKPTKADVAAADARAEAIDQQQQRDKQREQYERRKQRTRERDRAESAAGKDIGEIPGVKNPKRRKACEFDLLKHLLTYNRDSYALDFSQDQLDFIAEIERRVLKGGQKAKAMPRGSGKTTIIVDACGWAQAHGHPLGQFVVLIGAEQEAADELCDDYRIMWETNELLAEDFPEIAAPIRALEGVVQRAKTQTINGRQSHLRWSGSKLVLPTVFVPASDFRAHPKFAKRAKTKHEMVPTKSSGFCLRARGLLSRLRGMKAKTASGETIRPTLVLVEDFQTDASATSDTQCATREKLIAKAVLGLAGPGKRIAAFVTCTVIRLADAADRLLNRKLYPKWNGSRCKLVNAWPTETALWDQYQDIRQSEIEAGDDEHPKATDFYKRRRRKMDAGADVPWAARKFDHELSAVEHAVNLRFDNPDSFASEYQNEPKDDYKVTTDLNLLGSDDHCLNSGSLRRLHVPDDCNYLSVGIDVQKTVLYYAVVAVNDDFGGTVVDYGAWPKQPSPYFELSAVETTLHEATGKADDGAAIRAGLEQLAEFLWDQEYKREDGLDMRIDRGLVDAGYETQNVYKWARNTSFPILASMGYGVTAKQKPWDTHKKQRGEQVGHFWRIPSVAKTSGVKRCDIDTNTWKTTLLPRFALPDGNAGRWSLYRRPAAMHRMIADHLSSEYAVKTAGRGRELYEWSKRPGTENHLLDSVLYAAVAANMAGARLPEETVRRKRQPPKSAKAKKNATGPRAEEKRTGRKSLAELRAEKRKAA